MLFWRFYRGGPTDWICKLKKGRPVAQGLGLSFYYLEDFVTIVSVPSGVVSTDFHFEERTNDYQTVHVQGIVTWQVVQPEKVSKLLNFSVDRNNRHVSEDPVKLEEKLQNLVAVLGRRILKNSTLEEALKAADALGAALRNDFKAEEFLSSMGLEIHSVEILSIKPEPDVGRALEASTREQLLKQSDDATAQRRLAALENERLVDEREAGNQLAKEKAARSVADSREKHETLEQQHQLNLAQEKLHAELARRAKEVEALQKENINEANNEAERDLVRKKSALELMTKEQELAQGRLAVAQKDAEAEKVKADVWFSSLRSLSAEQLESLSSMGSDPATAIAKAFQKIADRAGDIGQLNISPDLLQSLLKSESTGRSAFEK